MVKSKLAEVRDQLAHASAAVALMYLFLHFPILMLAVVVMTVALIRELNQHEWRDFGMLDMIFWAVGCALFIAAFYTVGIPDPLSIFLSIRQWV
ncbi:hypothetical protein [Nitrosospira sp. Nsp1]|uniref:hypothetical protein n=1 Tax=Nitrosospira sp. Nsp1 TaxID=136547 RepID=UPI000887A894|nr:hypothetical protein [Nitrosospira sp. Nsp1]SCX40511.1 hypothetical protein SAMN05720354_103122 [Nitrosospira sp. Nsp1]